MLILLLLLLLLILLLLLLLLLMLLLLLLLLFLLLLDAAIFTYAEKVTITPCLHMKKLLPHRSTHDILSTLSRRSLDA
ncbi:hypothetical protein DPMN_147127 [Dreissena polymorpha]|uniref:Uncharacterized protein n=1 Tax=Dreissena polymorpha TaxID=45954 RepID=A0A9D4F7T6_DREPO|nr:hypothetical protein DPMN_147127 [Dreissena polymorpha]